MQVSKPLLEIFLAGFQAGGVSECWIWCGRTDMDDFGLIPYRGGLLQVHEISFSHYRYSLLKDMKVTHTCDNSRCVNPYHLQARFPSLMRKGEHNYNAILKEKDIPKVRQMYEKRQNVALVARSFQVSEATVRDIIKGRTWKHA